MICEDSQETLAVCHSLLDDASFWSLLSAIDEEVAATVRSNGCECGGRLHKARYPRKPRGWPREQLGEHYTSRLSFCCDRDGCRRRCTPPSVRYFGRRVYLGVVVTLSMALEQGLTPQRRARLVESIGVDPRTLTRWCRWWRVQLPLTRTWRELQGQFASPLDPTQLPDALLQLVQGEDPVQRLLRFLALLMPLSSSSCSHCPRVAPGPQRMSL